MTPHHPVPLEPRSAQPPEVRMGNDIARQFAHLPPDRAVEAVASHLRAFWDPRMRARLASYAAEDPDALDPLLVAASRVLSGEPAQAG